MKPNTDSKNFSKDSKFILALHSSSDQFGIGLIQLNDNKEYINSAIFPIGKDLSSQLFKCIEQLLPAKFWSKIIRIAVATGPGGYTGTRTTIVFARTIGQQINCQVDGISSFELMVPRLLNEAKDSEIDETFWIIKSLKRKGLIGGKYKIINKRQLNNILEAKELVSPILLDINAEIKPQLYARDNVQQDVLRLLEISLSFYKQRKISSWKDIFPIYPTSPVKYNR